MIRVMFFRDHNPVGSFAHVVRDVDVISYDEKAGAVCRMPSGEIMSLKSNELFSSEENAKAAIATLYREEMQRVVAAYEKRIAEFELAG